jgi:hypothetical protein
MYFPKEVAFRGEKTSFFGGKSVQKNVKIKAEFRHFLPLVFLIFAHLEK